jgi:hypothetical protein
MKKIRYVYTAMILMFFILAGGLSYADQSHGGNTYAVTITNLTRGQVFSPPIVISHKKVFNLFTLGDPASDQIYPLAEDGDTVPLVAHISGLRSVLDYTVADGNLFPGDSVTLEVKTRRHFRYLSVAAMLVTTNDAFFAVRGLRVPGWGRTQVEANVYDAGSEANSESCGYIPGPPCGNGGVRDTEKAEGYIHVHAGIHGIADLDPAVRDWRNPAALITVHPVY